MAFVKRSYGAGSSEGVQGRFITSCGTDDSIFPGIKCLFLYHMRASASA